MGAFAVQERSKVPERQAECRVDEFPDALIKAHELVWSSSVGTIDERGAIALPPDRLRVFPRAPKAP